MESQIGKLPFDEETLRISVASLFKENRQTVDIIFVDSDYIRSLNQEFRGVDSSTDVLSFTSDDEKKIPSEVYISPDFIVSALEDNQVKKSDLVSEILRMIIHGILHITGYKHDGFFEGNLDPHGVKSGLEEMFEVQENKLVKLLEKLKINVKEL